VRGRRLLGVALAAFQSSRLVGSAPSLAQGDVPNLSATWVNPNTPNAPWQLQASGSGLSSLHASWKGGPGHPRLVGSFDGTLGQESGAYAYAGTMHVVEGSLNVTGTMTIRIVSAGQISVTYRQSNGPSGSNIAMYRSVVVEPAATAFGAAVTADVGPGAVGVFTSPTLPSCGGARTIAAKADCGAVSVSIGGLTPDDLAAFADLRHDCLVNFVQSATFILKNTLDLEKEYPFFFNYLLTKAAADFARCVQLVDALQAFLASKAAASRALSGHLAACPVRPVKLALTGSGAGARPRSIRVGRRNDTRQPLRVTCTRGAGSLTLRIASRSAGTPLRSIVGRRLRIGIVRSPRDPSSARLSVTFRKG
jgi:hypothetical protein